MKKFNFIFSTALKSIIHAPKRYIISGCFLLCTFSVFTCILYFYVNFQTYVIQAEQEYLTRLNYKFKKELQWLGTEEYYNGMGPFTVMTKDGRKEEIVFNSDKSMDKYNKPVYVDKDYFSRFAKSRYITDHMLAYTENVYGIYDVDPDEYLAENRNTNFMYGGSFDDFKFMFSGFYSVGYDFKIYLTEGDAHKHGECLLFKETAAQYGFKVGDYITYKDRVGNYLGKLKISGFFTVTHSDGRTLEQEFTGLKINGTNPFFRNVNTYIRYMIITDFDDVYNIYGENHEINKYLAWYILDDIVDYEKFIEESRQYNTVDTMGFYPDVIRYDRAVHTPLQMIDLLPSFAFIIFFLAMLIIILTTINILRARRYEFGIHYAVGATKKTMFLLLLTENTILIGSNVFLSLGTGLLLTNHIANTTPYIDILKINYTITSALIYMIIGAVIITSGISFLISAIYISRILSTKLLSVRR